jgi:di/tricarboxylate transporter
MFSAVTLMLIGGFAIAAATTKSGVGRQVALFFLKFAGNSTGRLLALVMFLALFISSLVSNVTAPVLCFTLLSPLLQAISPDNPLGQQLVLAVAAAANIGGAISPVSSPQNLFAVEALGYPSWGTWLGICVPFTAAGCLACWALIMTKGARDAKPVNFTSYFANAGGNFRWGAQEITVVVTILLTVLLWGIDGGKYFGSNGIIAMLPVAVFFGTGLLGKEDYNSFSWNVVMLAIGGSLMGDAVDTSGLLGMVAESLRVFATYSTYAQVALISLVVTLATCFISHTVGAMIFIPIVKAISNENKMVMMAATLACSAGMALPISSFPNMAASSQENNLGRPWLSSGEFVRNGIYFSLLAWVTIATVGYVMMTMIPL